uniref:Capsid protein n=1 Tax=Aedes aegypti totivirus TaxID=2603435 RepID=A0A894KM95_9VIRU|nr:MAG: capsid protein [Aedes aegypti totivirus]QRW42131.1 MAG: capsid protein [Aedes aegypti totivirus]
MSVSEGAYIGTEDTGFTLVEKSDPSMHPTGTEKPERDVRGVRQNSASGTIITAHDQVKSIANSDAHIIPSANMSTSEEGVPGGAARRQDAPTSSSDSGYGGSALALASIWNRPIPEVAPRGAGHWRSHGAARTYALMRDMLSPQYIADPLYVIGYKWTLADVEHNVERIQAAGHIVSVSGTMRAGTNPPELSDRGAKLWSNAVLTPVDASMQIRNLIPTGGSVNLSAMTQLVSKYHGDLHTLARDEAPLLRMLLMFLTFLPAGAPGYASNTIKMLRLGAYQGKCTKTLHPYDQRGVLDNTIQIPANCAECDVRIVPLSTYVNALCAKPNNNDRLTGFNILEAEVVAIESHNLEQNWFMAFLIAHTSTIWWNCAATEEYDFSSDPKSTSESKSKFVIKTMTRASCVYVPGEWKKIAIVVVDQDYSMSTRFSVPHLGDAIKFETKIADFTKKVFTYLGLTENGMAPDPHTMLMAVREMCKRTALSGDMGTVLSMVQELAFAVPLGGAVRTDGVFGASGVGRFDINAADYLLDKTRTTDLAKEWDTMSGWLTGYGDWCATPTGKFVDALFQCDNKWTEATEEKNSRFALYSIVKRVTGYGVTQTSGPMRVLRECGCFRDRVLCEYEWNTYTDLFNALQSGASLMAGVSGWMMCEIGYNIMDLNGLYASSGRGVVDNYSAILLNSITSGFISNTSGRTNRYSLSAGFISAVKAYTGMANDAEVKMWPTVHVPWWFVHMCVEKFGQWTPLKEKPLRPYSLYDITDRDAAEDIDTMDCALAFKFTSKDADWREFPAACGMRAYNVAAAGWDKAHPQIYLPGRWNGFPKTGRIGWMPYVFLDDMKHNGAPGPWSWVMCEPQALPMPRLRQVHNPDRIIETYIVGLTNIPGASVLNVSVSMDYPDPPPGWMRDVWEYLKSEARVATPHLLRGDVLGAIGSVGIDTVVKAVSALSDKLEGSGKRKFVAGLTDGDQLRHVAGEAEARD